MLHVLKFQTMQPFHEHHKEKCHCLMLICIQVTNLGRKVCPSGVAEPCRDVTHYHGEEFVSLEGYLQSETRKEPEKMILTYATTTTDQRKAFLINTYAIERKRRTHTIETEPHTF